MTIEDGYNYGFHAKRAGSFDIQGATTEILGTSAKAFRVQRNKNIFAAYRLWKLGDGTVDLDNRPTLILPEAGFNLGTTWGFRTFGTPAAGWDWWTDREISSGTLGKMVVMWCSATL